MRFQNDGADPYSNIIEEVWAEATRELTNEDSSEVDLYSLLEAVHFLGKFYSDGSRIARSDNPQNLLVEDLVRCLRLGLSRIFPQEAQSIRLDPKTLLAKRPWSILAGQAFSIGDNLVTLVESARGYTLVERSGGTLKPIMMDNHLTRLRFALKEIKEGPFSFKDASEAITFVQDELSDYYKVQLDPSERVLHEIKDYFPQRFT